MTDHRTDTEREADKQAEASRAELLTFLRSTTTTTTHIEQDGDTSTSVTHLARFAVRDDALDDLKPYDSAHYVFRPAWCEVVWNDGRLDRVLLTGPRILKHGGLSQNTTGRKSWHASYRTGFDREALPSTLARRIHDYERAVSTMTGRS
jgi:hypothetical protein